MRAASAANIRLVLPAALIRSAPFVVGALVFVREVAGFKSSVFCATGVFDGELPGGVVLDGDVVVED